MDEDDIEDEKTSKCIKIENSIHGYGHPRGIFFAGNSTSLIIISLFHTSLRSKEKTVKYVF